jgi:hypothetical protein
MWLVGCQPSALLAFSFRAGCQLALLPGLSGYRKALPHEDAVAEVVASAGRALDPLIVETLLAIVGETARAGDPVSIPERATSAVPA